MAMEHTKDCEWRTKYNVSHDAEDPKFPKLGQCKCECHGVSS